MCKVKPHELFLLDFNQLVEEGKRQEDLLKANTGESGLCKDMHVFFDSIVLPLIISDDWVFDAANRFAAEYAMDCFRLLRLTGTEVYNAQQSLIQIKREILQIIEDAKSAGYMIPFNGELEKASDFIALMQINRMPKKWSDRVNDLYRRTTDREEMHVYTALRGLRDMYEISLPRIMFVVKRAIKVVEKIGKKPSDNELRGISEEITWYAKYIALGHPLFPVFGRLNDFYKITRNVGNHHQGFRWDSKRSLVILEDRHEEIEINVSEFIQKFRHLVYVCELGVRGILASFCEREHGKMSNQLVFEYIKIFPPDWNGEEGVVDFYS